MYNNVIEIILLILLHLKLKIDINDSQDFEISFVSENYFALKRRNKQKKLTQ